MANPLTIDVRVLSPKTDLFVGKVLSVSSTNSAGDFDILPEHAKFVTLVENKPLILRLPGGEKREFNFPLAILHAYDNKVDIFTNPEEIEEELREAT